MNFKQFLITEGLVGDMLMSAPNKVKDVALNIKDRLKDAAKKDIDPMGLLQKRREALQKQTIDPSKPKPTALMKATSHKPEQVASLAREMSIMNKHLEPINNQIKQLKLQKAVEKDDVKIKEIEVKLSKAEQEKSEIRAKVDILKKQKLSLYK